MQEEYFDEKKQPVVNVSEKRQSSDGSSGDIALDRQMITSRFKAMNNTGDTGDSDPLADKTSAYLYEMLLETSLEDSIEILKKVLVDHYGDPNFDNSAYDKIEKMIQGPDAYGTDIETHELDTRLEAVIINYHSPYPEVRAVTDPFDDPTIPVETIRAYVLGCIWVAVGSFINEFFYFRQPSLTLQSTVIQLFLYPCGKFTEFLPDWGFKLRGTRYSLNPGPWNFKEQMLATIMVNVGGQTSNWMSMTVTLRHKLFFGYEWVDFGFVFVMNFASLFFGYGLAGIMRKLVIFPVKAVFPNVLPTLALSRALVVKETKSSVNGWTISRHNFFFLTFGLSFLYFFVPSVLFKALSTFNWMTWIAPNNVKLAVVTGSFIGFGLNPITSFDWAVINYSTPLVYPFNAWMNKFAGVLISGVIMMALYFTNYKWTGYIPLNSNSIYDRFGKTFNLTKILTNGQFDEAKYLNYSAPYMSAGHIMGTGGLWAVYTCTFTYILISEHKLLWETLKKLGHSLRHPFASSLEEFDDPHSRLMARYKEVPDWWYIAALIVGCGTAFAAIFAWPTTVPIWTLICIFLFNIAMFMPTLVVFSRTGFSMGFGAFSVILAGYMDPGNAITNIVIRMWGYNIDNQSESFIGDQKIAHYARIPQRATFRCQMVATLIQCCCTAGAVEALMNSVKNFCNPTQADKFTCPFPRTVYSEAIMFGIINPDRVLTTLYPALKHSFYIGALIAIPFGIAQLRWPQKLKLINPAVMGYGTILWGGTYNLSYYIPGAYFSFFFMYYIRRRFTAWWTKYNYILTSGLSAGVAFSGIIIFAALQYTQVSISWWGNNVYASGIDYARVASIHAIPEEGFGLQPGEYS
ncbi:OPT oligopeptide transporter protein-domain-containing protein [Dipodascopsis uninucleata]